MLTLLRETPFIKEWQSPHGSFIDSKLRWLGIEPSPTSFLAAWRAASESEKFDLEAAFQFYPYELEDDIDQILSTIAALSPEDHARAHRMAKNLFRADSQLSPDQQRFLSALGDHLEQTAAPMRLVGENQWFAAYANDAGFHIDPKVSTPAELPTPAQLDAHINASLSLAYRRILQTVKDNPHLLHPRPGEQPFPQ